MPTAAREDIPQGQIEDVPGTTDMSYAEGQETALGLALYPTPSQDPNDPLSWPKWKKTTILLLVSAYSFLANSTLFGPSVYVNYLAQFFHRSPSQTSQLVSYPNLLFGFGSIVFVPMYHKIGRRPTMLISLIIFAVGILGCALSKTYDSLLAFRIIHGFGSSVCEALPAQVVADIYFIHERGKALGWYTFALASGPLGAVAASYMLSAGLSYNLFFWVSFALACLLFLGTFFAFEETMFFRDMPTESAMTAALGTRKTVDEATEETIENPSPDFDPFVPARKTYLQQLKPWGEIDHNSPVFLMIARSFTYFLVPQVFWVITTYGMVIGLAALAFTATFPILAAAPPYNWAIENTGLVAVASFVGYLLAVIPFHAMPDRYTAYLTRKNGNIRESEFGLWSLVIVALFAPAGLLLYGFTAEEHLHWMAFMVAIALFMFGSYFYMTFTLAYALESYQASVPEMLIAMNLGKQAISFGFGFSVIDWIMRLGYVKVFSGIFCGVQLINNLTVVVFLVCGKKMRIWLSRTWLGRMHSQSAKEARA